MTDDMSDFEAQMSDVPNAFDEVPGVSINAALAAHLEDLLGHFVSHCLEHLALAAAQGMNTVSYVGTDGATMLVRASTAHCIDIQYRLPPDTVL